MPQKLPDDQDIVYAKIHPSIGIARVGNSKKEDGFYIGPETVLCWRTRAE